MTPIKIWYLCRWCKEPFTNSSEYFETFKLDNRLYQMHDCKSLLLKKNQRRGIGDLVGYEVIESDER
jgi:hypothetical protein